MESFAVVVRTLLARIRDLQNRNDRPQWPPPGAAGAISGDLYRTAPTAWGIELDASPLLDSEPGYSEPRTAPHSAEPRGPQGGIRGSHHSLAQRLELALSSWPVPRGLPAT